MPVVAQRQNPTIVAAAATSIQLNRALYSFAVPAFGLVLLVLALKKGFTSGKHSRSAYVFIASLAVLSGLAGSLGSHAQAESIIQASLSLFLCIPVLHLTSVHNTSALSLSRCQIIVRTLLKSLLFISLSSATLLVILNPFLTHELPAAVRHTFPATLCLVYTIPALCLLLSQIFYQENPAFSTGRRGPITINIDVATPSAAVPINLARSSGFSATNSREQRSGAQELDKFSIEFEEPQKRPSVDSGISIISTFKPTIIGSAHPSRSNSREGINTPDPLTVLQFRTRIQDLPPLLFLLLTQFVLVAAYICKLILDYKQLPSTHVLEIIHTSLKIVGVMATMKTYLLHAYNAQLGSLGLSVPNSRSSAGYSNTMSPNLISNVASKPLGHTITPPIPPKSLALPSSMQGHRLRVPPSLDSRFNHTIPYHRPRSTISDHDRSTLQMNESDEKGRDIENGRLVNSFSVGSLKSAYGTSGSEESDQTRVEGSVESNTSGVEELKRVHTHTSRCHRVESPEAYTERRTIPAPPESPVPKKLLGFGWLNGIANRYRTSRGEKGLIGMGEGRYVMKSSIPSSSVSLLPPGTPPIARARGRETKKLKRNTAIPSPFALTTLATPTPHTPSPFTCAYWNSDSTLCRTSSDMGTDMSMGNSAPATPVRSSKRKLAKKRSCEHVSPISGIYESLNERIYEGGEEAKNGRSSYGRISSPGSLRLKRSFKLDDGRTLSPQLTLAAAIVGEGRTPSSLEAGTSSCSRWERVVERGRELIRLDGPPEGMPKGDGRVGSRVKGAMTAGINTESDGKWEGGNALRPLSETPPHRGPGKSRERPKTPNKSQCLLDVSVNSAFIPATSGPIKESISTASVAYPSTPSKQASCSSSVTATSLVPDRTPMIFRSTASDHGHGGRSLELFPLARISSSPSSRTLLRRHNAGTPTTPTRGRSTFSSSSSSSSLRLSAVTIEGVRNAFSGIWSGKRGGKAGVQHTVPSTPCNRGSGETSTFGGATIVKEDIDDDFMDLRDPFASAGKVRRIPSGGVTRVDLSEDGYGEPYEDIFASAGSLSKKNTRRKSPVTPTKGYPPSVPGQSDSYGTYLLTGTESTTYFSKLGDVPPQAKSKEHRKERRSRKRTQRRPKIPMLTKLPVLDDGDFDIEEALLTQMLLKRLDDDIHGLVGVRL